MLIQPGQSGLTVCAGHMSDHMMRCALCRPVRHWAVDLQVAETAMTASWVELWMVQQEVVMFMRPLTNMIQHALLRSVC